jgi:hypothetical protein
MLARHGLLCAGLLVALAAAPAHGDILNWGFETGDFDHWTSDGDLNAVITGPTPPLEGDYYATIKAQSSLPSDPMETASLVQVFTLPDDADVLWFGVYYVSVDNGNGVSRSATLTPLSVPGGPVDLFADAAPDGNWTIYGADVSALQGEEVELRFEVTAGGGASSMLAIDKAAPEPASLMLLVIGGAALLRRRRR